MLKIVKKILLALLIGITFGFTSNVYALYNAASTTPTNNEGQVLATKTAQVVSGGDGRSVDISFNVGGVAFTQATQVEREIVLVLDDSTSMDEYVGKTRKHEALKAAAKELVENLLSAENAGKIKVGVAIYGSDVKTPTCGLSNSKSELNSCIDRLTGDGGTNIQAGLKAGNALFTNSTTSVKSLILLSDGIPTYYTDSNGVRHGTGRTDEHEVYDCTSDGKCYDNSGIYIGDGEHHWYYGWIVENNTGLKPSEAAIAEANTIKSPTGTNATIYTVGFDIDRGGAAETFLKSVASSTDKYFPADSIDSLKVAFAAISSSVNVIAEDVKVVDNIPSTFAIDTTYFTTNFGQATVLEDGSVKYGNSVIVKTNGDGTTTVTWLIGNLDVTKTNDLTFRVTAKENYYGNMFTNSGATVTGRATNGNKFYGESNAISISLTDPTVVIPAVTANDSYNVNQGQTLNINKALGLRNNDYSSVQNDKGAEVVDEVLVVTGVSKGSLTVNTDGSFTYQAPTDYYGDVTFTYYIKTTVELDGQTYEVESNISTVTIKINRIATTYTVIHYINGTSTVLDANGGEGYVYESATGYAFDFPNYKLIAGEPTSKTITLVDGYNLITFYYELEDGANVTVHYYVEGSTTKLAEDVVLSGKVTESYTSEVKSFDNYELVSTPANANGVFTKDAQEVVYYYRLIKGGDVIVHHYLEGTTTKLATDTILKGKINQIYVSAHKFFDIYELVEMPANAVGRFKKDSQEVIYYYRLKQGGKVTVYYLEKDTTNEISDTIELNGKVTETYESEALDIANWKLVEVSENATGEFTLEEQVVIYYYEKVMGTVTVKYVDIDGNELSETVILEGQTGTTYETEKLVIDGYVFKTVEGIQTGEFTEEEITVIYVYEKVQPVIDTEEVSPIPNTGVFSDNSNIIILVLSLVLTTGLVVFRKKISE